MIRFLFLQVLLVVMALGCSKRIDPYMMKITPEDRPKPNANLEFLLKLGKTAISGIIASNPDLGRTCRFASKHYFDEFEIYSNLRIKNIRFNEYVPTIAKELAQSDSKYFFAQSCEPLSFEENSDSPPVFQAKLVTDYFDAETGKFITKDSFIYDSKNNDTNHAIRSFITAVFPERGFITETRGSRSIGKISLGRIHGVNTEHVFILRTAEVKDATQLTSGLKRTVVYGTDIIGSASVIFVEDESAWLQFSENYKNKIKPGTAAFLYVEP